MNFPFKYDIFNESQGLGVQTAFYVFCVIPNPGQARPDQTKRAERVAKKTPSKSDS
jgi:hypothetical protein